MRADQSPFRRAAFRAKKRVSKSTRPARSAVRRERMTKMFRPTTAISDATPAVDAARRSCAGRIGYRHGFPHEMPPCRRDIGSYLQS